MTSQEAVVQRINELCRKQDLTYYSLAFRSAIPKSSIMNILYGTNPTISTLNKICGGFDISLKDFFDSPLFLSCDEPDVFPPAKE